MKTLVALRHLVFEDLGLLAPLLQARGWRIHYYDVGIDELWRLDLAQVDMLVVLGGPIGAEDDELFPFLTEEVQLVRARLASRRPILGICLGAQLMARALGARVRPMAQKEIGWRPVALTAQGEQSPLAAIGSRPVLHWHGDQFELPESIQSLAATPLCPHQAFQVERYAMAWQFHLEADATRIEQWLIGHAVELAHASVSVQVLRDETAMYGRSLGKVLDSVMSRWLEGLPR